jgi:large repetitive protein
LFLLFMVTGRVISMFIKKFVFILLLLVAQCTTLKMPPIDLYVAILLSLVAFEDAPTVPTYTISGTVEGLTGTGLVLKNSNEETLSITANGAFSFATPMAINSGYTVTVATQPTSPQQTCTVTNGSGVVTQNVTGVSVNCTTNTYTIGGTITGLTGTGLVVQNGTEAISVSTGSTSFVFTQPIAGGSNYLVFVATQPANQTCTVSGGTGTVTDNVSSVNINCNSNLFTVGGTVTGLTGTGLVLQLNGANNLSVNGTSFAFPTPLSDGTSYTVSVLTQPTNPKQNCVVNNGMGSINTANVNSVNIACVTPGVSITGVVNSGVSLAEGGTAVYLSVVLHTPPLSSVSLSFSTGTQLNPIPSITFTSDNWNVPQTISISAIDDTVSEGLHSDTISITITSTDTSYNSFPLPNITATITDNDSSSVVLSAGSLSVTEGGGNQSYTLKLSSQPTADVMIQLNPGSQLVVSLSTLTFTPANWNVLQTVTVSAIDDHIVEGDHSASITHTITSTDTQYNGLTVPNVMVSITDNDTASVYVSTTVFGVSEGGVSGTYSLSLLSIPATDVTVSISAGTQLTVSPTTVVFTPTGWNIPQTITVTAVDDTMVEGTHAASITHTASSGDGNYNSISVPTVTVTITDNDTASVVGTNSVMNATENNDSWSSFPVTLSTQPTAEVFITIVPDAQVTTSPTTIVFKPDNWKVPQYITVYAVDDDINEGTPHTGTISYTVSSADSNYNGIPVNVTTVNITDNDNVPPSNLVYTPSTLVFAQNTSYTIVPTYTGTITSCTSSPAMPNGMTLATNCTISGTPTQAFTETSYTITASNGIAPDATASISIAVNAPPAPEINVKQVANIASSGTYNFGVVAQGGITSAITFTIENLGNTDLNLTGSPNKIVITGTHASEFSINETATISPISSGSSTTFTITFAPTAVGTRTAQITIANNDSDEGNYVISLTGSGILVNSLGLLKTGQTVCYDAGGTVISCAGTGQDGELQKTVSRGYIDNGDGTITDNATGLIWQKCSAGFTDGNACTGGTISSMNQANAVTYCSSLPLASKTWRLPHITELSTLTLVNTDNPSIAAPFFPSTPNSQYWSSTVYAGNASQSWFVRFDFGTVNYTSNTTSYRVRCVSGSPYTTPTYTDNNNGTVTDNLTGLVWQKCSMGTFTNTTNCTGGTASTTTWTGALSYCNNLDLGGHTDWRLPNRNELQSLVDYSAFNPSVNNLFPNTVASYYWSSTTYASNTTLAWNVNFFLGFVFTYNKSNAYYVRCVSGL